MAVIRQLQHAASRLGASIVDVRDATAFSPIADLIPQDGMRRGGSKAGTTARPEDLGICFDNRLTASLSRSDAIVVMRLKPAGHIAGQPGFEALG